MKAKSKPRRPLGPSWDEAVFALVAMAWPIILVISVLVMASACVVGPDGRRVLSPGARAAGGAVLEDVLACGLPLALGAVAGEPDYVAAATCHLRRVGERLGQNEGAPVGTVEHGREVVRAAELEQAGDDRGAKAVAQECEATARARLAGEAVEP